MSLALLLMSWEGPIACERKAGLAGALVRQGEDTRDLHGRPGATTWSRDALVVQGRGDARQGGDAFLLQRVDHGQDIGGTIARDVGACYGARSVALP
jgi:hypothetical protein